MTVKTPIISRFRVGKLGSDDARIDPSEAAATA